MRVHSEFTVDQEENRTPDKKETTLRERLTHDRETPGEILFDDLQERTREFRTPRTRLVAVAHGKRIEARILEFYGEDERTSLFRFLARRERGRSNDTPLRLERKSVRVQRQTHLRVVEIVDAALLLRVRDF